TEPMDRSMPPVVMTKVMPMASTPAAAASRRMVMTLSMEANRSPAVIRPTRHSRTRATTRPRLRPHAPDNGDRFFAVAASGCGAVSFWRLVMSRGPSGPVLGPLCHRTFQTVRGVVRYCSGAGLQSPGVGGHDEVQHGRLVEPVGRSGVQDLTVGDDQNPVGQT